MNDIGTKGQWQALPLCLERLCSIYWGPTERQCRDLLDPAYWAPFHANDPEGTYGIDALIGELKELLSKFRSQELLFDHLEENYVRLFINAQGGIAAPLYASCYEEAAQPQLMGRAAEQIQRILERIGLSISPELGQPPDHLAIAIEIVYYILDQDHTPCRPQRLQEAAEFIDGFLMPWVLVFSKRLESETRCRFYPLVTQLLQHLLSCIVSHASQCA
jgi:TorA maturation chaperone TorD